MHAMAGTTDGVMNHTVSGARLPEPLVQRHARRRDRDQRGAVRHVGLPGPARHRRRRRVRRGAGAARRRPDDRRGQAGARRDLARQIPPVRARELIEEGARKALSDLSAVQPYDPGSPCEIEVEFKHTRAADRLRFRAGRRARRRPREIRVDGRHVVGGLAAVLLLGARLDAPRARRSRAPRRA